MEGALQSKCRLTNFGAFICPRNDLYGGGLAGTVHHRIQPKKKWVVCVSICSKNLLGGTEIPAGPVFIPLSYGFGAFLSRFGAEEVRYDPDRLARAARWECELLSPDLLLINPDPTILAESCGCSIQQVLPYRWQVTKSPLNDPDCWMDFPVEDPEQSRSFKALIEALPMVVETVKTPVAALLPAPFTLARQLAGASFLQAVETNDSAWQDLVDDCMFLITDAVKLLLRQGSCGIAFHEDFSGIRSLSLSRLTEQYGTVFNVLRHHGWRCLYLIRGGSVESVPKLSHVDAIAGMILMDKRIREVRKMNRSDADPVLGGSLGDEFWEQEGEAFTAALEEKRNTLADRSPLIFSPQIPASAKPERVQALVKTIRR